DRLDHYLRWRCTLDDPFVELDLSHSLLDDAALQALRPGLQKALQAMAALEAGGIANRDEQRMVGHYWLRAPGLAPGDDLQQAIVGTLLAIEAFAARVHQGRVRPAAAGSRRSCCAASAAPRWDRCCSATRSAGRVRRCSSPCSTTPTRTASTGRCARWDR